MRDLLTLVVVFGSLPVTLLRPFVGLVVFCWLAFMRPHSLGWGVARSMPLSDYVVAATLLGMAMAVMQNRERLMTISFQTIVLVALCVWVGITSLTGINSEVSLESFKQFGSIVLIGLITTGLVQTEARFRVIMIVTAFSLGLLGLKYGVFGTLRGGAQFDQGPGGFMGDNNNFALALNMAIPLLVSVGYLARQRLVRIGAFVCTFFSALTVVFTFSRGGFLSLAVVGLLTLMFSGRRILAILFVIICIGGGLLIPSQETKESYVNRIATIGEYEEDRSALGRLEAWNMAWSLALEHPLVGVGPDNFKTAYSRVVGDETRVVHNAYLEVLSACGFPGLFLYLSLLVGSSLKLEALRRRSTKEWVRIFARSLQISIAGFVVGSMFLDRAFFDLIYHVIALSVCLEVAAATRSVKAAAGRNERWWERPAEVAVSSS